ncbi:hypothetical protein J1N35_041302, partial [Gossypium stocksii]
MVLKLQRDLDITFDLFDGYRVLRSQFYFPKYDPDERIMPYLQLAGFRDVVLIRRFDRRENLIFVLVERWCTETHTFIMPCGGVHYHIGRCRYATWVTSWRCCGHGSKQSVGT